MRSSFFYFILIKNISPSFLGNLWAYNLYLQSWCYLFGKSGSFLVFIVYRFGASQEKVHIHHHMEQLFELFSKLVFAWPCTCTWYHIFLFPGLPILYTMNGGSGGGWVTSTCLALQHAGNIISFGQFQRLQLSFPAWVSVAGQSLHQSHVGIGQKMLIYWVLSL